MRFMIHHTTPRIFPIIVIPSHRNLSHSKISKKLIRNPLLLDKQWTLAFLIECKKTMSLTFSNKNLINSTIFLGRQWALSQQRHWVKLWYLIMLIQVIFMISKQIINSMTLIGVKKEECSLWTIRRAWKIIRDWMRRSIETSNSYSNFERQLIKHQNKKIF